MGERISEALAVTFCDHADGCPYRNWAHYTHTVEELDSIISGWNRRSGDVVPDQTQQLKSNLSAELFACSVLRGMPTGLDDLAIREFVYGLPTEAQLSIGTAYKILSRVLSECQELRDNLGSSSS